MMKCDKDRVRAKRMRGGWVGVFCTGKPKRIHLVFSDDVAALPGSVWTPASVE